jgi:hypothetical protein
VPLLPDSLRQQLAPVVKHHFWILAALVPLLLVPAVFMANGQLKTTIDREKATIDGHVSALGAIRGEPDHPNDAWVDTFDARSRAVRDELLREWQGVWESQGPLRSWPAELGPDFLASVQAVASGSRRDLQFRDLQRYMNTVPDLVRQLPQRMGCEELMTAADGEVGPGRGRLDGQGRGLEPGDDDNPEASQQLSPLEWRAEDQKRLFDSFRWNKAPTTTQVLLAQEELWIYGLFCDTIRRMNQGAKGAFDASITTVDELAVGYPAAEDNPGGKGTGRIIGLRESIAGPGVDDGLPMDPAAGMAAEGAAAPQVRPPHPRFSGGGSANEGLTPQGGFDGPPPGLPAGEVGEGAATPALTFDDHLKHWIYVDFTGRPLSAPELGAAPDAQLVHLVPFLLRVTIDQRQVDRLLADLAANSMPIDVRQVRINPSAQPGGGAEFGLGGGAAMPGSQAGGFAGGDPAAPGDRRRRTFDVTLELRGTVGLATPPNPATLGAGAAGDQPAAAGEGA